jgi:hypothetical protein
MSKLGQAAIIDFEKVANAFYQQIFKKSEGFQDIKIPVIGFAGKAGSGKDSAGDAIESSGIRVKRESFAEPIRKMIKCLGIDVDKIYKEHGGVGKNDPIPEFGGKSLRFMLQTLGTDWGRNMISDSIWLDIVRRNVQKNKANGYFTVITDVRFDNEAEAIRQMGGVIIQVEALGSSIGATSKEEFRSHASEAQISRNLVDFTLVNQFYDNPVLGKHVFMTNVLKLVNTIIV